MTRSLVKAAARRRPRPCWWLSSASWSCSTRVMPQRLDHEFGAFAHRQTGARFGDAGQHGLEIPRPQSEPGLQFAQSESCRDSSAATGAESFVEIPRADRLPYRRRRRSPHRSGPARSCCPTGWPPPGSCRRRAADRVRASPRRGRMSSTDSRVKIPLTRMLHHGAGGHFAECQSLQTVTGDQVLQCGRQHFLIAYRSVGSVAAREGNACAADDRHPTQFSTYQHGVSPWVDKL